jgi:hypothetical protein
MTAFRSPDLWTEVVRLTTIAQATTFRVGDVWLSPGCFRFRVDHVTADGTATFSKAEPGWSRAVSMRWNSPKLSSWQLL